MHCHNFNTIKLFPLIKKKFLLTVHNVSFPSKYFGRYFRLYSISNSVANYIKSEGYSAKVVLNGVYEKKYLLLKKN